LVGRFQDQFDQKHRSIVPNRTPAVFQNPDRVVVGPIMYDGFRDVRVRPFRNRLKEIDADDFTAIGNRPDSQSGSASYN
jgi:hypothetical protein